MERQSQTKRNDAARRNEQRRKRKALPMLFITLGIIGLAVCIGMYVSRQNVYEEAAGEYRELYEEHISAHPDPVQQANEASGSAIKGLDAPAFRVDIVALRSLNADCIGWIEIPKTAISYPVLRGEDNAYYVNHTFQKSENKAGAIFMDYRCKADFGDAHTILYGHNMKDGSMFALLDQYQDTAFLEDHQEFYIHQEGRILVYRVISAKRTDQSDMLYSLTAKNGEEEEIRKRLSVLFEVPDQEDAFYLTLSTCADLQNRDARDIVIAILTDIMTENE